MNTTRRKFIRNSVTVTAGATLANSFAFETLARGKKMGAIEKINVGLIGCRSQGFNILKHFMDQPEAECIALCDVDMNVLQQRAIDVEKIQGKKPALYDDFRKLLENKDIDVVIIGTPDHWHCLMTVAACQAGKDIYVEKPMANSIEECNVMVAATRKYNRIVQVGQQQRSGVHWRKIMSLLNSNEIGKLRKIKVWGNFDYGIGQPVVPDEPVPPGVNFDMWLGPAPNRSFNKARYHGSWRMFWDYGGGLLTDWGVHLMDMALWVKSTKKPPKSVMATGGNFSFPGNAHETPDTLSVIWEMDDDYCLTWDHTAGTENGPYDKSYGIAFTADNGTIIANRESWELKAEWRDEKLAMKSVEEQKGKNYHEEHVKNFLACVKSGKNPNCPVETGRAAAMYAHLGNIACRTGTRVVYDAKKNIMIDNPAAEKMRVPQYRSPWKLPII